MKKNIADDPVKQSNLPGTICFAAAGQPNTRSTQVFINFRNNANLDSMGFAAFGKVTEGMDVVLKLNGQYNEQPTQMQGQIASGGNEWLDKTFPGLDYIKTATIIP
jgi:peptidyl-prolyl cis-trans isomerase A (cyclophilin A)